jgi:RNA polymerase sigma-70 factor (ECF subfamily)
MRDRITPSRALAADPGGVTTVQDLVDALPEERRIAFVLTQVVGCSYAEAASVCGVPLGTIRSRVARAREQLADDWRAAEAAGAGDEETG